jgi:hypothetical protein
MPLCRTWYGRVRHVTVCRATSLRCLSYVGESSHSGVRRAWLIRYAASRALRAAYLFEVFPALASQDFQGTQTCGPSRRAWGTSYPFSRCGERRALPDPDLSTSAEPCQLDRGPMKSRSVGDSRGSTPGNGAAMRGLPRSSSNLVF